MITEYEAREADKSLTFMISNLESDIHRTESRIKFLQEMQAELKKSLKSGQPTWAVMSTVAEVNRAVEEKRPVNYIPRNQGIPGT
jgi:SMC interacting uncharacterized protein involved in chromosome segregation